MNDTNTNGLGMPTGMPTGAQPDPASAPPGTPVWPHGPEPAAGPGTISTGTPTPPPGSFPQASDQSPFPVPATPASAPATAPVPGMPAGMPDASLMQNPFAAALSAPPAPTPAAPEPQAPPAPAQPSTPTQAADLNQPVNLEALMSGAAPAQAGPAAPPASPMPPAEQAPAQTSALGQPPFGAFNTQGMNQSAGPATPTGQEQPPAPAPMETQSWNSPATDQNPLSLSTSISPAQPAEAAPPGQPSQGEAHTGPVSAPATLSLEDLQSSLGAGPPTPTFVPQNEQPAEGGDPNAGQQLQGIIPPGGPDGAPPPPPPPGMAQEEPAPTDLSHLVPVDHNNADSNGLAYTPAISAPDTLIVPAQPQPAGVPESINTQGHKANMPKILLFGGAALVLLAVSAASAYFILGIGKNSGPDPQSIPAQPSQQTLTTPPSTQPAATSEPTEAPAGSGDPQNFSQMNGGPSAAPSKAPSAIELLRQRQQSGTPAPSASSSARPTVPPLP